MEVLILAQKVATPVYSTEESGLNHSPGPSSIQLQLIYRKQYDCAIGHAIACANGKTSRGCRVEVGDCRTGGQ